MPQSLGFLLSWDKGSGDTGDWARYPWRMRKRLETLDSEFKAHHYALVEQVDEEALQHEQEIILDEHDDEISTLDIRIQQLIATSVSTTSHSNPRKVASRRLAHLQNCSWGSCSLVWRRWRCSLSSSTRRTASRLQEDIRSSLLSMDLEEEEEEDELTVLLSRLEKELFDCSLSIKKTLKTTAHSRWQRCEAPKVGCSHVRWRHPQLEDILGAVLWYMFQSLGFRKASLPSACSKKRICKVCHRGPVPIWRMLRGSCWLPEIPLWPSATHPSNTSGWSLSRLLWKTVYWEGVTQPTWQCSAAPESPQIKPWATNLPDLSSLPLSNWNLVQTLCSSGRSRVRARMAYHPIKHCKNGLLHFRVWMLHFMVWLRFQDKYYSI